MWLPQLSELEYKQLTDEEKAWVLEKAREGCYPSNGREYVTEHGRSKLGWLAIWTSDGLVSGKYEDMYRYNECHGCGRTNVMECGGRTTTWDGVMEGVGVCVWTNEAPTGGCSETDDEVPDCKAHSAPRAHCKVKFILCRRCIQRSLVVMSTSDHLVRGHSWLHMREKLRELLWAAEGSVWLMDKQQRVEHKIKKLEEKVRFQARELEKLGWREGDEVELDIPEDDGW